MHQPEYNKEMFKCFFCGGLTQHKWSDCQIVNGEMVHYYSDINEGEVSLAKCLICKKISIWYEKKLIYPLRSTIENPNDDMPRSVKDLYNEAREVYLISKKSSAALLRLALQYLCIELGESGKNINIDIGNLVKKGLSKEVQMALDGLRITGNQSVHPGELNVDENEEMVESLFFLLNFITEKMITDKRKVEEFYEKMPKGLREAVKKRDNKIG